MDDELLSKIHWKINPRWESELVNFLPYLDDVKIVLKEKADTFLEFEATITCRESDDVYTAEAYSPEKAINQCYSYLSNYYTRVIL